MGCWLDVDWEALCIQCVGGMWGEEKGGQTGIMVGRGRAGGGWEVDVGGAVGIWDGVLDVDWQALCIQCVSGMWGEEKMEKGDRVDGWAGGGWEVDVRGEALGAVVGSWGSSQ